jgi:hypothetical protein
MIIINYNIAVILFTMTIFFGSVNQLISIASIVNIVSISNDSSKESNYVENAKSIASGDMKTGIYKTGPLTKIIIFISYVFPLYFGGKFILKNKFKYRDYIWFYNLAVFTLIVTPIFSLVDVYNRITGALMFFSITFVGISVLFFYERRNKNNIIFLLILMSLLCSSFIISE